MTQRHLSYSAILVLAANTMNGPGITTLPDVAVDAGIFLYFILIALSVRMASFVCHRMVHAMWSSLKSDSYFLNEGDNRNYERVDSVESDAMSLFDENENILDEEIQDAVIQLTELHHDHPNPQMAYRQLHSKMEPQSIENIHKLEPLTLLETRRGSLHDNVHIKMNRIHHSILEHTSTLCQSLENFSQSMSAVVGLTMVAAALWLVNSKTLMESAICLDFCSSFDFPIHEILQSGSSSNNALHCYPG